MPTVLHTGNAQYHRVWGPTPERDEHYSEKKSLPFEGSYIGLDGDYEKLIYPGMVVALDFSGNYCPYNEAASYGPGSDTAVGVLRQGYVVTNSDPIVAPMWHAVLQECYCFVYGSTHGTVPAAVKAALVNIEWV